MSFKVYHQVGHNAVWSIQSLTEDSCGDGLILSPVHQDPTSVGRLSDEINSVSIFDPQFYLPSSQKRKLKQYEFFPETIANGFNTITFEVAALEAARKCVSFQLEHGFQNVVIPVRYLDEMYSDYIERQEAFSVIPFLKAIQEAKVTAPVCLTLVMTTAMLEDEIFRTRILNWVTKYPEISQIYLIYSIARESKQIQSSSVLIGALDFASEIRATGLDLIIGYQNTEALLFSLLDDVTLTFGTFENTRIFSIDKFLVSEEERRGPKPRIYLPGLLNWIQYEQAVQIRKGAADIWDAIYVPTDYSEYVLGRPVEPFFNQPELYKHHLLCMEGQFSELAGMAAKKRATHLKDGIKSAVSAYSELEERGFLIEKHGNGAHLSPWNVALAYAAKNLI